MFKVMTWNLENLYRPGSPYGPPDQTTYEAKLAALGARIDAQAPDALAVQEIGEPQALQDLVQRLSGRWDVHLSQFPDQRGIRVAWLTRGSASQVTDIRAFQAQMQPVQVDDTGATDAHMGRGALALQVSSGGGQAVWLVTAHLKSKLLSFPGGRFQPKDEDERARFAAYALFRRSAEAATLRASVTAALDGEGESRPLILTGDLNDTPQAATTELLFGPPGSQIGSGGFGRPDAGDHTRLWDLSPRMPPGKDYSRVFEGRKELIDQILVSAALVDKLQSIEALVTQPPVPSISVNPMLRRQAPESDHAPVVAEFDI